MDQAECRLCGETKDADQFQFRKDSGKRRTECRACCAERTAQWRRDYPERNSANIADWKKRNPDKVQRNRLTSKLRGYGLTSDQYNAMVERQGGRCAICDLYRPLVIDHCHTTGEVRGLLCGQCNTALGMVGDSLDTIERYVDYLKNPVGPG